MYSVYIRSGPEEEGGIGLNGGEIDFSSAIRWRDDRRTLQFSRSESRAGKIRQKLSDVRIIT